MDPNKPGPQAEFEAFSLRGDISSVRNAVAAVLGNGWKVEPFGKDTSDYEVRGGALSNAEAWELTYRLREQPGVLDAEPLFLHTLGSNRPPAAAQSAMLGGGAAAPEPHPTDNQYEWQLDDNHARIKRAWELKPPPGGRQMGEGIIIGHPDTGYGKNVEITFGDRLLIGKGTNFQENNNDPLDILNGGNPGHGTGTASIIISNPGRDPGWDPADGPGVTGAAPKAQLIPIRMCNSVIILSTSNLTKAIRYATDAGAHVISISLGGLGSRALRRAIQDAQARGVIVCCAAGQWVEMVAWPGAYEESLTVSASGYGNIPWRRAAHGRRVDLTAPGEKVWRAQFDDDTKKPVIYRGEGTSFAVALVAGVAALWLAFHGRDKLIERYGASSLPHIFRDALVRTVRRPAGWDPNEYGAGIVDAEALLKAPLPPPGVLSMAMPVPIVTLPEAGRQLSVLLGDASEDQVALVAQRLFPKTDSITALAAYGDELVFHAAMNPEVRRSLTPPPPGAMMAPPSPAEQAIVKERLRASGTSSRMQAALAM